MFVFFQAIIWISGTCMIPLAQQKHMKLQFIKVSSYNLFTPIWLVVSTHFKKYECQNWNLPPVSGWKFQKYLSRHHLDKASTRGVLNHHCHSHIRPLISLGFFQQHPPTLKPLNFTSNNFSVSCSDLSQEDHDHSQSLKQEELHKSKPLDTGCWIGILL